MEGRRLTRVLYCGRNDDPEWRCPDRDRLDHGVELEFDDGSSWFVTWAMTGEGEDGLEVIAGRHSDVLRGNGEDNFVSDVGPTSRWAGLIGRTVTRAALAWEPWEMLEGTSRRLSPDYYWSLTLEFDDGRTAVLARGDDDPAGRFHGTYEIVSIFFDLDVARRRNVCC